MWEHFEKIIEKGKLVKVKCFYCAKTLHVDSKINGTSSYRNHMLHYRKNLNPKSSRQSLLTLQHNVHSSDNVGVIGTWTFDQDAIRIALSNMVIINELPFKFVEGEEFKLFMYVICPRFKIPSRWIVNRDCYNTYMEANMKLKNLYS